MSFGPWLLVVTFGGGEPLVRRDMGAILQYAKAKGFAVFVSTNGVLLPEQAEVLEWVDHVNLSLDGNREVHDLVRGAGTFDKALAALEVCRERGVGVSLQCVLNKNNLDAAEDAIAVARKYGVSVMFQPATRWLSSSRKPNPIAPDPAPYRRTMAQLVALKREGAPIRNSVAGLRHLARWPDPTRIWCIAGVLIAVVEADGSLLGCHQCQVAQFLNGQAMGGSLREQFAGLRLPEHCAECWCAPLVELALVFSLRPEPVLNAVRMN